MKFKRNLTLVGPEIKALVNNPIGWLEAGFIVVSPQIDSEDKFTGRNTDKRLPNALRISLAKDLREFADELEKFPCTEKIGRYK